MAQNRISESFIRDGWSACKSYHRLLQTAASQGEITPMSVPSSCVVIIWTRPNTSVLQSCLAHEKLFIRSDSRWNPVPLHLWEGFPACLPQRKTPCALQLEKSDLLTSRASSWPCGCTATVPSHSYLRFISSVPSKASTFLSSPGEIPPSVRVRSLFH